MTATKENTCCQKKKTLEQIKQSIGNRHTAQNSHGHIFNCGNSPVTKTDFRPGDGLWKRQQGERGMDIYFFPKCKTQTLSSTHP